MKDNEGNNDILLHLFLHLEYRVPMNIPVPDNELLHRGHMHRGQQVHRAFPAAHRLHLRLTTILVPHEHWSFGSSFPFFFYCEYLQQKAKEVGKIWWIGLMVSHLCVYVFTLLQRYTK